MEQEILELYYKGYNCTEIGEELGIHRQKAARYLTSIGIDTGKTKAGKKYFYNNLFNKITNEEEAYWLGFLYADGNISGQDNSICLGSIDREHIEKFKYFIGKNNSLYYHKDSNPNHSKYYSFKFSSYWVHKNLENLGCVPKKSLILKCPTEKQVSQELFKDFVRGYFDGDGHIGICATSPRIKILGTYDFLNSIQIRMNWYKQEINKQDNIFSLTYYGKDKALKYLDQLYEDSNIYLDRKYNRYIELKSL